MTVNALSCLKLEIISIIKGFKFAFLLLIKKVFLVFWRFFSQGCDAQEKEAKEAKERHNITDVGKLLPLQKKEEVENKLKKLKMQLAA